MAAFFTQTKRSAGSRPSSTSVFKWPVASLSATQRSCRYGGKSGHRAVIVKRSFLTLSDRSPRNFIATHIG